MMGPPMINMLVMNCGVDNLRKGVFIAAICYQQLVLIWKKPKKEYLTFYLFQYFTQCWD